MKILLAGKHVPTGPRQIGGVQSWIKTVAAGLSARGHDVYIWGPEIGPLGGHYDFGIIANAGYTGEAFDRCRKTLLVSHGIIPAERPDGGSAHAFTSEEIREYWDGIGRIIRQPIDLAFWHDAGRRRSGLLRYSYRAGLTWLPDVANRMGLPYSHVRAATHEDARNAMQSAACVIATGRAALEAMACGAPVVICDHRSAYQGPLHDPGTFGAMSRNYSGRGGIEPTAENITAAVKAAIAHGSMRGHVEQHHDAARIVDQLLEAAC